MPDADDFDVEYFRNLLKGNSPKEAATSPAAPALPVAKEPKKPTRATIAPAQPTQKKSAGKKAGKRA